MLVDELNEMGLPNMAAELDKLYAAPGFLEMDRLTLISELISPEYKDKISKRINNRLRSAKLIGCPAEIGNCTDSQEREYLPSGIPQMLSTLDFIPKGFNICILGASDTGKTYLAKAIGIKACTDYRVGYFHCEELLENLSSQKQLDYGKYSRKLSGLLKQDLLILDDFLLHTIVDEAEIKILFALLEGRSEKKKSTIIYYTLALLFSQLKMQGFHKKFKVFPQRAGKSARERSFCGRAGPRAAPQCWNNPRELP